MANRFKVCDAVQLNLDRSFDSKFRGMGLSHDTVLHITKMAGNYLEFQECLVAGPIFWAEAFHLAERKKPIFFLDKAES